MRLLAANCKIDLTLIENEDQNGISDSFAGAEDNATWAAIVPNVKELEFSPHIK